MTFDTQDERFPAHGNHDAFPQCFTLYVFQLSHMMGFEISPLFPTVLALVGVGAESGKRNDNTVAS